MSGITPIGPMQEFSPNRREEQMDQLDKKTTQPTTEETSPQAVEGIEQKKAEKSTLYDFKYTGMGSFIDKVF